MATTISMTVVRSSEWVAARRLATGDNVPTAVVVKIDPAQLSEAARRPLLVYGCGAYRDVASLSYGRDYEINYTICYGREEIRVDADAPTVAEVDAAILAAAERIAAKRDAAAAEKAERARTAAAAAAEWASLPLAWRATAAGVAYCVPLDAGADYRGPLTTSGSTRYNPETLKEHAAAAWAEAAAERDRLNAAEKATAAAQQKLVLDRLAEWVRGNGSELARLRLEEGYDCWVTAAREELAAAVAGRVVDGLGLSPDDAPDGYTHDDTEPRKCPTAAEIRLLRAARDRAVAADWPVTVGLERVTYQPSEDEYGDRDPDVRPITRTELAVTIDGLPGGVAVMYFTIPAE